MTNKNQIKIDLEKPAEYCRFTLIIKTGEKMTLKFSDGIEFDTSGPLRIESRSDGLYVVGNGQLIPVSSREEAEEIIKQDKETKSTKRD
jgi:hypothetical protein